MRLKNDIENLQKDLLTKTFNVDYNIDLIMIIWLIKGSYTLS